MPKTFSAILLDESTSEQRTQELNMKTICVLGLGYIGLPTAAMFATHGFQVVGVDVNESVLATLNSGDIHIHEPGLKELVHQALVSKSLRVSGQTEQAEVFIIAVPTPFKEGRDNGGVPEQGDNIKDIDYKRADMSFVISATESIVPHIKPNDLVVLESTSPPRTTVDQVKPILERSGLIAGRDFFLAYSPERVLPGKILQELVQNARVIGGIDAKSAEAGRELYSSFVKGDIVLTDATTAEMVKLMENTSRDVNIALANEFSQLGDRFGVDMWGAIEIANLHPRVDILRPGPGVGGHCISVDPWFLVEAAPDLTPLIRTARQVNDSQPMYVMELIRRTLGDPRGRRIALLGLTYKSDVDDLRESPSITIANLLVQAGADIVAYEPFNPNAKFDHFRVVSRLEVALSEADALILLVAHKKFRSIKPSLASRFMSGRIVVDIVNILNHKEWKQAGFDIIKLGAK